MKALGIGWKTFTLGRLHTETMDIFLCCRYGGSRLYSFFMYNNISCCHIENGCILILKGVWRPAMGSRVSWIHRASLSICECRFRLLGDELKLKSVTPYCQPIRRERGSQPWGGGNLLLSTEYILHILQVMRNICYSLTIRDKKVG